MLLFTTTQPMDESRAKEIAVGNCPTREELVDYALGRLPETFIEPVSAHTATCSLCEAALNQLDATPDRFVAAVREASLTDLSASSAELDQLIGQATTIGAGAAPPPSGAPPAGGSAEQLGQYELIQRLGQGAMGTVYKARHTRLKRTVAIKLLPSRRMNDPQAVSRFHREMEAVGKLDHENIVRASDAGEVDGRHFLVMEFVEGLNFTELVERCGPLSVPDTCELIRQAAIGLQHAHERGLIHRDIKPSNLMLSGDGRVKLLDLGLALLSDSQTPSVDAGEPTRSDTATIADAPENATAFGQILGTRAYMAPEQAIDSHDVDARADIYSLGCTMYKLLTGKHPPGGGLREIVPSEVESLVNRMLARQPEDRLISAAEIAATLQPLAAGADIVALLGRAQGDEIVFFKRPPISVALEEVPPQPIQATPVRPAQPRTSTSVWKPLAIVSTILFFMVGTSAVAFLVYKMLQTLDDKKHSEAVDDEASAKKEPGRSVLRFSGSGSYVEVTGTRELVDEESEFTAEMWFRVPLRENGRHLPQVLLGNRTGAGFAANPFAREWSVETRPFGPGVQIQLLSPETFGGAMLGPLVRDTNWHHLAVTKRSGRMALFLDGAPNQIASYRLPASEAGNSSGGELRLGGSEPGSSVILPGCDVRAFRLSTSARYDAGFEPAEVFKHDEATVVLLDFDGSSDQLTDLTGNGHHGRTVNATWLSEDE